MDSNAFSNISALIRNRYVLMRAHARTYKTNRPNKQINTYSVSTPRHPRKSTRACTRACMHARSNTQAPCKKKVHICLYASNCHVIFLKNKMAKHTTDTNAENTARRCLRQLYFITYKFSNTSRCYIVLTNA